MLSKYLLAGLIAWVVAQLIKYIIASIKKPQPSAIQQLYLSGGMPSAHSATCMALLVTVGLVDGIGSAVFAVAALLSAIVMYDSVMVRRSSGEQGNTIYSILKETKSNIRRPFVAKGHSISEVVAGAIIGWAVGLSVVYLI